MQEKNNFDAELEPFPNVEAHKERGFHSGAHNEPALSYRDAPKAIPGLDNGSAEV